MSEEPQIKNDGTPRECWLDFSASQIPFPSKTKAREFLSIVTEEWGFAAIALSAKGKHGYVLLPPEHFGRLLLLWRHVWNDPLGRQTKVLLEPGKVNDTMTFSEIGKNKGLGSVWSNILQGVAVVVVAAAIISQVHGFAKQQVLERDLTSANKMIEKLERRLTVLEGKGPPR